MTKAETLVPLVTSARGTGAFTTSTRGTGAFDGTPTNRCQPLPRRAPQENCGHAESANAPRGRRPPLWPHGARRSAMLSRPWHAGRQEGNDQQ